MKFGTSGLRGLVSDLEGRASALYATAFARHLVDSGLIRSGGAVLIGRDLRSSSPGIAATCIGALQRAGLTPIDCGAIPTPALALYAMSQGAAALMVTGSHIPDDRNGIKFYRPDGEIDKKDEIEVSRLAADLEHGEIDASAGTAEDRSTEAFSMFMDRNAVILKPRALAGLKVGVYQHSTVARTLFVQILEAYGAEAVPLGHSESFIAVDTEAVSAETISLLKGWAKEFQLDAIVSADGDGDRPLVADETGEPLRGDLLGLVTADFLKAETLVTPVTSNSAIEKSGAFRVVRTKVGSPFVIAGIETALREGSDSVIGFEANGGTLTGSEFRLARGKLAPLPTRDSVLPVLATLALRAQSQRPLSQVAAGYGLAFAMADRLENFPVDTSAALMRHLQLSHANLQAFLRAIGEISHVDETDGLRILLLDGKIVHLRPSGNAPEMRCYVEAETEEAAGALLVACLDLVRSWASSHQ